MLEIYKNNTDYLHVFKSAGTFIMRFIKNILRLLLENHCLV